MQHPQATANPYAAPSAPPAAPAQPGSAWGAAPQPLPGAYPATGSFPPVPPPPTGPGPRGADGRRFGIGTVLLAAFAAALLAGATGLGVGLVVGTAVGGETASAPLTEDGGSTDDGDPSTRTAAEALPVELPVIEAWVEERVGAEFTSTPVVEPLPDDEFEDALMEPSAEGGEPEVLDADDYTATVHALGLVPDVDTYEEFYDSGYASSVVGFYDSSTERLAVRGTQWSPIVEVTVVHELVHALQDQVVDLDAVTATTAYADETYLALSAVIEGQATAVENDWLAEQDEAYQDSYWEAMSSGGGGGAYDAFAATMSYLPYDLGEIAVDALEESSSPAATLDALRAPPTTTEQLFDMAGWASGAADDADPVAIDTPQVPADAELVDEGTLGVYVLGMLGTDPGDWGYADDLDVPQGWAGDRYATWEDGDRTCTDVVVRVDDPASGDALVASLDDWSADGDRSAAVGDGSVLLRSCTG